MDRFSSDWEDLGPSVPTDDSEEPVQSTIDECLRALQESEEEEDNSRNPLPQINLYSEAAELLHQLSDKLPAPGRALVDVLLFSAEAPRLKDCIPAIGAVKHLKEWHAAKVTIVARDLKGCQNIAKLLSANILMSECPKDFIDPQELWRGSIGISERKFVSEVEFPDFCLRAVSDRTLPYSHLGITVDNKNGNTLLPEVFHYYGASMEYVQMVALSETPSYFISDSVFELNITRNALQEKSKLMLDQLCSLKDKVGALFMLPCNVCSLPNPPSVQRSSKKWKEYISRKPKDIKVPSIELKGEHCCYHFLVQGKDSGLCKATLLRSANQINGAASLVLLHNRLNNQQGNSSDEVLDILDSLPHFHVEQIVTREKLLAHAQAFALTEYLKRQESKSLSPESHAKNLTALMGLTREHVFEICGNRLNPAPFNNEESNAVSGTVSLESRITTLNPTEWPERSVLQNLENFEKIKQRTRASILSSSAEQLLGRRDGLKEGVTLLDAKELLRHFTPQGLAVSELQPLQVQRGDNAFLLTPKLTPRKLQGLPFEDAAACHYHGLEYCLDNRKALDRDVSFTELQSRLIRYETQTTCTREGCPLPFALSPLPSPAVLSEPGSVPDGESMQSDLKVDPLRLKRRSKDLDVLYAPKRLSKSESSDSLVSLASESSGYQVPCKVARLRSERGSSVSLGSQSSSSRLQPAPCKPAQAKPEEDQKESRSQKHNRMLKEVVCKTLQKHGIGSEHPCYIVCSQRLFEISKFFLKDLKTSRGLFDEMKKAASNNVKQVIQWELDKLKKK
ncbi:hypothetical protein GDO86_010732 [Hymenochirus boettgeri]|uniref:Mdm2-binding protein n=1 Tax=Hymenochirus boettgeri TaxID=247094 RepID=A0A8T2JDQ6_9PIPI|nr:hypothetical protein GDO86_010732 [Hymenochirus boettgeri]